MSPPAGPPEFPPPPRAPDFPVYALRVPGAQQRLLLWNPRTTAIDHVLVGAWVPGVADPGANAGGHTLVAQVDTSAAPRTDGAFDQAVPVLMAIASQRLKAAPDESPYDDWPRLEQAFGQAGGPWRDRSVRVDGRAVAFRELAWSGGRGLASVDHHPALTIVWTQPGPLEDPVLERFEVPVAPPG